jgi:hypothetical protein
LAWGIWITHNRFIFHDEYILVERVAVNCIGILASFHNPGGGDLAQPRISKEDIFYNNQPWGYFDGASSSYQLMCGGGGCLYITNTHYFTFKVGLRVGINNYS